MIELLVVIAVIAVLAAILFPALASAKKKAKEPVDISNMRQLYMAICMYEDDYENTSPASLGLVASYVNAPQLFASPGDVLRTPYPDNLWPAHALMPCEGGTSLFKISYAYLKSFPPNDENAERWNLLRNNSQIGILGSPWSGVPQSSRNFSIPCDDGVVDSLGPPMVGPILRVNMDGSFYRLAKNRSMDAVGVTADLFFDR